MGEDWVRRQREMAARRPELAVDRGTLTVGPSPLRYRVAVEGRGLHLALSPPRVTVGGIPVTDLEGTRDGTSLRGRVAHSPPNATFVIDYGFANAETTLTRRTRWWHWFRPALLQGWIAIDRVVRRGLGQSP
jgi:hypothetical protein